MLREINENTYKIAFSMLKGASYELLCHIRSNDLSLEEFFSFSEIKLKNALNINSTDFLDASIRDQALQTALKEELFINKHNIKTLFVEDSDYPTRLEACAEPPLLLYVLGDCDLNAEEALAVVGTRNITSHGADSERKIISELAQYLPDVCIVSGLAFGTDAIAHSSALDFGCPTIAVVAHGLDTIYPAANRDLARRIIKNGGAIVSEYPSGTTPYRGRFLERNRIIAWMSDATLIVESKMRGGAMSTANHAFNENRDVFAIPGRLSDEKSEGCNNLIRKNKASLVMSANDIMDQMGWKSKNGIRPAEVRALFPELDGNNKIIFDALRQSDELLTPDALRALTSLPIGIIMSTLTELEFDNLIVRHPGNRFSVGV